MAGPGKGGRKPVQIPLDKVEDLAAKGLTQEQICHVIGISQETMCKYKRLNPELVEAIQRGKARGTEAIANVIYEKAKNGDFASAAFFLERRCGWTRKETLQHQGDEEQPLVIVITEKAEKAEKEK
ncbi:MAG TPA: hypothetical protein PLW40_10845 [Syntrophales bacterium]|nr:hypothetical protein [Syntrophales bacterium]HOM08167.1 hypothetical protein [Syntrophales bacterium]